MDNLRLKLLIREKLEIGLSELDLNTYANFMDSTESYPWTKFGSGDYTPHGTGNKKERVNNLARQRFEEEFYKRFPKGTTQITFIDNKGNLAVYSFHNLTWRTNYTSYDLFFSNKDFSSNIFFIMQGSMSNHTRAAGILDREIIKVKEELNSNAVQLTEESQSLLNQMVNFGKF